MSRNNHPLMVGTSPVYGKHNLSHRHLTTLDVGRIQVMALQECVTNDQLSCNLKQVVTCAPNMSPLQGKFIMHTAAFFVRNRIVMKDWSKYRSGLSNVNIPHFNLDDVTTYFADQSSNSDQRSHMSAFGINPRSRYLTKDTSTGAARSMMASLIPFRAYRRIWWDWFRNSMTIPDTQESSYLFTDNANEAISNYYNPHYANWEKDFMSNYLQRPNGDSGSTACSSTTADRLNKMGASINAGGVVGPNPLDYSNIYSRSTATNNNGNVNASTLTGSTGTTIQSLRTALGLQAVIEKMSALGGRLKDRLKGMFGSSVSYETLGMSELLGYNEYEVHFDNESAPVGTASPDADFNAFGTTDPLLGTIKGQSTGKTSMTENGLSNVNYHCTEDGYFIVLSWLTPDCMLSKGLDAHWLRGIDGLAPSRFDFLTDEFVGKGFDPVHAYELSDTPLQISDLKTYDPFKCVGFNAKYHNYTYHHDIISGDFVSPMTYVSMRPWYLERDVLKEQNVVDVNGDLKTGKTGTDVNNAVSFSNLQGLNAVTRHAYDANFMYTDSLVDHFVVQNKCELIMTRRLPSAPRVDMLTQSPVETGIGGTRL
nr:MAG: major capsid protein [Microviridae sp.]